MTDPIPNLWPENVALDTLPPETILRAQGDYLARQTQGLLAVCIEAVTSENRVRLDLDVVVPSQGIRHRLLSVSYGKQLLYPVVVHTERFAGPNSADTQAEFIQILRQVLGSGHVRSILQSVIAIANQATAPDAEPPVPEG